MKSNIVSHMIMQAPQVSPLKPPILLPNIWGILNEQKRLINNKDKCLIIS